MKNGQQSLRGGGGESVEDGGRSGHPQNATAYENVKAVHTLVMSVSRGRDLQA